jgi:hypothetical protein
MMVCLYPPLEIIRSGLFEDTQPAEQAEFESPGAETGIVNDQDTSSAELPPLIADLIRRRVAADQLLSSKPPAVGQIRAITRVPGLDADPSRQLNRTLGVLLGAHLGGTRWRGWLVTQEADYATDRDLVIEEGDAPCAPEAAMVQTWNEIGIHLDGSEALLGEFSPPRLEAVVALAQWEPAADNFVASRPGRIGAWDLDAGMTVVTGTPLGDADDPRHAYQELYRAVAQRFPVTARLTSADSQARPHRRWMDRLSALIASPAWGYAALVLVVAQGMTIFGMYQQAGEDGARPGVVYRSDILPGPGSADCQTTIHAVLNPESSFAEIIILLRKVEANVVAGPSETGEFWLSVPKGRLPDEAVAMLKASAHVQTAELVPPSRRGCGK